MTCVIKNRENLLEKYLTGQMPEEEKKTFEEHLFGCNECFNDVKMKQDVAGIIREEGNEIFSEYIKQHNKENDPEIKNYPGNWFRRYNWMTIPAAAMVLLVAGYIVLNHQNAKLPQKETAFHIFKKPDKNINDKNNAHENSGIKQNKPEEMTGKNPRPENKQIASNFEESPNFENLIAQGTRSDFNIEVTTPNINATFKKGEITFKWKSVQKDHIFLEIYTNKEHRIFTTKTADNEFSLKIDLAEGLYYWKLVSEDNLLFIGKFRVEK